MCGRTEEMIRDELAEENIAKEDIDKLAPHKVIIGNVPSNTILLNKVEPKTLGALIALYEHKVFVQGIIWQINSFDQWGVQLGKKIANQLVPMLQGEAELVDIDSSTKGLIEKGQAGF
jgi:glucose-6-phosphate isomerase